ncbi:MAG: hypothetical protein KBT13_05130 [Bacteroidales bacterium]|nr:hypothetical protein [Candidatus Sodaliphilus limicaballi]
MAQPLLGGLYLPGFFECFSECFSYFRENIAPYYILVGSMRTWVLTSQDLFLDKQLNLMNYFNWVLGYADWIDTVIADNEDKNG